MKEQISDYFQFTSSERKGIFLLLSLITFLLFISTNIDKWFTEKSSIVIAVIPPDEDDLDTLKSQYNGYVPNSFSKKEIKSETINLASLKLTDFDPNTVTKDQLSEMQLPEKFIEKLLNFRDKGGLFFKSEDFKKLYGIDQDLMNTIFPFVHVAERKRIELKPDKDYTTVLDLNSIGYRSLIKKFDLDTFFVKKLLKYRRDLGGFYSMDQIKEVDGYSSELCAELVSRCFFDSSMVHKLNLNTISTEELREHPYFSGGIARAITNYRITHGKFKSMNDLRSCKLFDDKFFNKVLPYIIIE